MNELKQEWIKSAKSLKDEFPNLKVTKSQYEWFGNTMASIKENSEWPTPCGTECRSWARGFFAIIDGGPNYITEFLIKWSTQSHDEWAMAGFYGQHTLYDLIGYGVQPLFSKLKK